MLNNIFDQSLLHHIGDVFDELVHHLVTLHGKPRIDFLFEITENTQFTALKYVICAWMANDGVHFMIWQQLYRLRSTLSGTIIHH
jgi:hypothetical protein